MSLAMRVTYFLKSLGKNLRKARMRAGLRQIDVNEKIGLTYRHYQRIEAGQVNLTVTTLCKLCVLFETPMEDVLEGCGTGD